MADIDMKETLESYRNYLMTRKDVIIEEIEKLKQAMEILHEEIEDKDRVIHRKKEKQRQENHIFCVFDTNEQYEAEIQALQEELDELQTSYDKGTQNINDLEKEQRVITVQLESNEKLQRKVEQYQIKGDETEQLKHTIAEKLQFCAEIIEVDKDRCALELKNMIDNL